MSHKAAARDNRKTRPRNHEPLLRLARDADQTPPKRIIKARRAPITPLTKAQAIYDTAIASSNVIFGIGPAGTGKTWLAAARAAERLRDGKLDRLVVTRPAVEAGESLGFLPGELDEKYEPYLRPVRDALEEILGASLVEYMLKSGQIEARPLGLIRGSTLKNCWVLADEMQNATRTQMKLLLTRIGEHATFIVNGDPDQCDLPNLASSGLEDAVRRLSHLDFVSTIRFTDNDIVRSGPCQAIVRAYGNSRPPETPLRSGYNESEIDDVSGLHRTLGVLDVGGEVVSLRAA